MPNAIKISKWADEEFRVNTMAKGEPDDLFISCVSYEPRSTGILQKLISSYRCKAGIFLVNEKFEKYSKVQENKEIIMGLLTKSRNFDNTSFVAISIDNPLKSIIEIDRIIKAVFTNKEKLKITLDFTTFPRGELLTILYYLRHLSSLGSIRLLYVSPQDYGDWLSEGYTQTIVPPFFEGPSSLDKKMALLLLTGFEYDRAINLIDDIQPSTVIIGKPKPGTSDKFIDISDRIVDQLVKTRKVESKIYEVPANDPFNCQSTIESIIKDHPDYDFLVAIMGSKLEVLGTYLAYEKSKNFRIIYALPLIYNVGDYSKGCNNVYEIYI
jgi:hypothetical protein